jgi:hypothetical protein
VLAAGLLIGQLGAGGSPAGPALDQLERSVTRPLPSVSPPQVSPPSQVWVPGRYIPAPGGGTVHVPGHWERRISDQEHHVPPLVVCTPTGHCAQVPAGTRRPPDLRPTTP